MTSYSKKQLYERVGVKEYWIVDPDTKSTLVYELTPSGYRLAVEDVGVIKSGLLQTSVAF